MPKFYAPDDPNPRKYEPGDIFTFTHGPDDSNVFYFEVLVVAPDGSVDRSAMLLPSETRRRFAREVADFRRRVNIRMVMES